MIPILAYMAKWASFLVIFFLVSCSPRVISFVNEEVYDTSKSSFIILNFKNNEKQLSAEGQSLKEPIESNILEEMSLLGFKKISRQQPDLLLRYELISSLRTRTDVNQIAFSPYSQITTRTLQESALLIELLDEQTRKLVWQGSVDLKQYTKKRKEREALSTAIANIFESLTLKPQ